ncbi:hypothetical protein MHYP_G00100980 [Metynnis hypsauchen]
MVKEPTEAVAMGTCNAGLLMYKALTMARCLMDEVPEPDGTSIATGQTELWVDSTSRTEAEDLAVRSAGALGAVVMVILQLVVAESVMLGVFKDTVVMKKLFTYLCSFSGLVSAALLVWILRWAGGYAASVAVDMFGVEGISSVNKTTAWTQVEFGLWAIKVRSNANMDFFKGIGDAAVGVVEGTAGAVKTVADNSVATAKGVAEGSMDYFFKAVSGTVAAVAGGTAAAAKALEDTSVEVVKGISEGFQDAMAEKDSEEEKLLVFVDMLTKPVAGGVSAGIKGIAKAPRKVVEGAVKGAVEGAVEANTEDVYKAIGATAAGLVGCKIGVMKAVVDTSVDIVKGGRK